MPTVNKSLIADFVRGYYGYVRYKKAVMRIGLNMGPQDLLNVVQCDPSANPGCGDVPINLLEDTGLVRAWFVLKFVPNVDYTLTRLSAACPGPSGETELALPLVDVSGLSIDLKAGAQYMVILREEVTYPTTITQQT